MKIRSTSGMLSGLLEMVARAVSARSTIPLLTAVLFEADEDSNLLTMKATDMEISVALTAETPVEEGGRVAIPAKLLLQYAKSLPEGEAELETDESGANATLTSGASSVSLSCYAPDDFPTLPDFPEPTEAEAEADGASDADGAKQAAAFSVDAAALSEAVEKVLPFASKDESRAVLMGVLVGFSEGSATLVATDSYRLGLNSQKLDGAPDGTPTAILPARALKEAVRLATLSGEDGRIEVALTENQAMFRAKGLTLATRLIDGNYPEYRRLLPDGFEETFRVDRDPLLTAIGRARIVAGKQTPPPPLKLAFSHEPDTLGGGEVEISLAADTGAAATEVLSADVPEGKTFEVCFNPHYLADSISSISDKTVALRFNDPLKPAVLRPASELKDDADPDNAAVEGPIEGHLTLIMPMRDPSKNGS